MIFALIVAGLETLGIGLFLPLFTNLITNKNTFDLNNILHIFGVNLPDSIQTFYLAFIIITILLIKNILGYLINVWNISYVLDLRLKISTRVFKGYVNAPYYWHISKNSAEIIRNVDAVSTVTSAVFQPIINIFVDIIFIVSVGGLLIWSDPVLTLVGLAVLGIAMYFFLLLSRNKITDASKEMIVRNKKIIKNIQEALAAIREVHIYGRAGYMEGMFTEHTRRFLKSQRIVSALQALPKYYLEIIFVLSVFAIATFTISQTNTSESLPILALFGIAAVRLLPSLNRVLAAITQIKSGLPSLKIVSTDLYDLPNIPTVTEPKVLDNQPGFESQGSGLKFENVFYSYPNTSKTTLSNINLSIDWGEMIGVVGQTGAGKSTLVDLMTGLLLPNKGEITINGRPIIECRNSCQNLIAYVPQHVFLLDDTIANNIAFGLSKHRIDKQRIIDVLEMVSLKELVLGLEHGLETVVGERGVRFSGGQRQRIGIARALYRDPRILILDEATSALDNETETQIRRVITNIRENRILVIVAHRLSSIRECDNLIFIKNGEIDSISPFDELAKNNAEFNRMAELSNIN